MRAHGNRHHKILLNFGLDSFQVHGAIHQCMGLLNAGPEVDRIHMLSHAADNQISQVLRHVEISGQEINAFHYSRPVSISNPKGGKALLPV